MEDTAGMSYHAKDTWGDMSLLEGGAASAIDEVPHTRMCNASLNLRARKVHNPYYDETLYLDYSERTRLSMQRVDEDSVDYEILESLVLHIHTTMPDGAILVFMPGMGEIQDLYERLEGSAARSGLLPLPLHSSLSTEDQVAVFRHPPGNLHLSVLAH